MDDNERRATIRLSDSELKSAKHAATDEGVSLQKFLRAAILEKIEKAEKGE